MDVSTDRERCTISINSNVVELPYGPWLGKVFDDVVVIWLSPDSPASHEPDVRIPDETRNLLAFDGEGTHRWTVEPYPDPADSRHYIRVYAFHDRCLCKRWEAGGPENWVEVDPRSGEIVETFPMDTFRIGGVPRQFSREIQYVFTFEETALVVEDSDDGIHGNYVTAFDTAEEERWRRQFVSGWLMEDDGKLLTMHEPRMGANSYVEHDPETGEPIAIDRSVFDTREQLERYLPESMHHLVDDYLRKTGER